MRKRKGFPPEVREEIKKRDGYRCVLCEREDTKKNPLTCHHIVPRNKRGTNSKENGVTICKSCHQRIEKEWKVWSKYFLLKGQENGMREAVNIFAVDYSDIPLGD